MATDNVAGLVGKHADDLIWRLCFHQRAGVDENVMRVHHESVERPLVDNDDVDVLIAEACHLEDRLGVVAQQLLDLGVANDRQAAVRRRLSPHRHVPERECGGGRKGDNARRWPRQPRLARRSGQDHLAQRLNPRSATHAMDGAGRGQRRPGVFCCSEAGATKPGEYGRMGAGRKSDGRRPVQEFTAV
jgi:hypothetical protein